MATGGTGRRRSGSGLTGVLIVVVLGVLLGLLFVANKSDGSARGTGHDPANVFLPKTVEQKHQVDSPPDSQGWPSRARLPSAGLLGLRQSVYGDAPGTPGVWVVMTAPNEHDQAGSWLAANAPSTDGSTVTHPQLRIAGATACYQDQHDSRTTCTWYDENLFLLVAGPADDAVQQVLLRVYDGTEH
ncbi:hypothetical protein P3T36_004208 [Kitasatospora sp. MAP12-15]|uniref:hypothetical protein n=1 Tax=unclassified Kitasatospora TaxID=2633591 RepID=UPI002476CE9D|nr:hypothetical protein [Kitasatospora sp. MAP12-44]MDH6108327.1 hypothetical protein [Kitasatospora sp. MAP12-44]